MTEELQPVDRNVLKTQALLNRVTSTENENADLRVEIHLLTQQVQELSTELKELKDTVDVPKAADPDKSE